MHIIFNILSTSLEHYWGVRTTYGLVHTVVKNCIKLWCYSTIKLFINKWWVYKFKLYLQNLIFKHSYVMIVWLRLNAAYYINIEVVSKKFFVLYAYSFVCSTMVCNVPICILSKHPEEIEKYCPIQYLLLNLQEIGVWICYWNA